MRMLAGCLGMLAYAGLLLYMAVRNYSLLTRTMQGEFLVFALLSLFMLVLSAVGMPLAIYQCSPGLHRLAAIALYVAGLAILTLNAILDFSLNAGASLTDRIRLWLSYSIAATLLLCGAMWAAVLFLDPAYRRRQL